MSHGNFIEDLAKRLNDAIPPSLREVPKDLEKNIHAAVKAVLSKFDFITREEFDAQAGVLAKTRRKLEALEKHVADLEKKRHSKVVKAKKPQKRSHKAD